MGQKAHPTSLRLGIIKTWNSRWFAQGRQYVEWLGQDIAIREWLTQELKSAALSKVEIERSAEKVRVILSSARPGVIIGRRGTEIDRLRSVLNKKVGQEVAIDIREIKVPAVDAQLIAQNISFQLVKRIVFRRAMKKAIQLARESGAKGIRVQCDGRLNGAELSRQEKYLEGSVPLGTFRADIDYGFTEAHTTYGAIGIKVWVYKGDIIKGSQPDETPEAAAQARSAGPTSQKAAR
jgi:small subunit ribosomal protein S3